MYINITLLGLDSTILPVVKIWNFLSFNTNSWPWEVQNKNWPSHSAFCTRNNTDDRNEFEVSNFPPKEQNCYTTTIIVIDEKKKNLHREKDMGVK